MEIRVHAFAERGRDDAAFTRAIAVRIGGSRLRHEPYETTECNPRSDVAIAIPDIQRAREVDFELLGGATTQQCAWLPAFTWTTHRRIVWTVKRGVDTGACVTKQGNQPIARGFVLRFGQKSLRNSGLVGDDNYQHIAIVQRPHRVGRAGEESHTVGVGQVNRIFDQRAVAVEKRSQLVAAHSARACNAALARSSSRSGNSERRSSWIRSSTIRPMMGCAAFRSFSSRSALLPRSATALEARRAVGNAPPPTAASLATTSHGSP